MKEITLTQGKIALVDDEDYERVAVFKWHAVKGGRNWYARATIIRNGRSSSIGMHQVVLPDAHGLDRDHIDHNGLNNQKSNLRLCTHTENLRGRLCRKSSKSGFKGVSWSSQKNKWKADISINGRLIHLGFFVDPSDGGRAYDVAAREMFGEFAYLNFPEAQP